MKKTLISLMALAGVASADVTVYAKDQANAWLDAITANYRYGLEDLCSVSGQAKSCSARG